MSPIPLARSSGAVTSATKARAMAMLAVAAPAKRREASSTAKLPARPYTRKARAVAKIEASSTGRRPIRSESRPQIGAKTNCMAE